MPTMFNYSTGMMETLYERYTREAMIEQKYQDQLTALHPNEKLPFDKGETVGQDR